MCTLGCKMVTARDLMRASESSSITRLSALPSENANWRNSSSIVL